MVKPQFKLRNLLILMHGDMNCDGEVNFLDIGPFIGILSSGSFSAKADINQDESVNLLDILPFVVLLSGR